VTAVLLVTEGFLGLAKAMALNLGLQESALITLPIQSLDADYGTEEDLERMADDALRQTLAEIAKS
jgi:hypothetical protein